MTLDPLIAQILGLSPPEPDYRLFTATAARLAMAMRTAPLLAMAARPDDVQDIVIAGRGGDLSLRLLRPSGPGPHPVIVFLHGGGWVVCSNDTHQPLALALMRASGAAVLMTEYRLAPEHPFPAALEDGQSALDWLASHGRSHDLDPARIAVAGDSAGGNLAAVLARHAPNLRAQYLIYPVTDLPDAARYPSYAENDAGFGLSTEAMRWYWQQYGGDGPDARPMLVGDLSGLPPALVQTAQYDVLRDEGEAYARRMADAGVDVTVTRYPGMVHGFVSMTGMVAGADKALAQAGQWLRQRLA
ncbi:alpha/beta hydrolase [Sandarakinorhabdus sp.]|uniref:alpha/beta hydrolase n=1 Tax=Sandarakinorhabdus sp. TaxID=1916663 RepID=UPI00286E5635|nr:alpha/beta hydrolase [Sandarakinorhabdus sp.]